MSLVTSKIISFRSKSKTVTFTQFLMHVDTVYDDILKVMILVPKITHFPCFGHNKNFVKN